VSKNLISWELKRKQIDRVCVLNLQFWDFEEENLDFFCFLQKFFKKEWEKSLWDEKKNWDVVGFRKKGAG